MLTIFASWCYRTLFVEHNYHIENLLNLKAGAVIPLLWTLLVTIFMAFVIHTSPAFHKRHHKR